MLNALNHPKWSKVLAFPEPLQVLKSAQYHVNQIWVDPGRKKEISSLAVNLQSQVCYVCSKDHDGAGKGQTIPLQESSEWRENEAWHWDRSLPFGAHSEARKGTPLPATASLQVFGLYIFIHMVYIFLCWRKLLDKEFQVVLEAMCCWGLGSCMLRGKRPALSGAAPGLRSQPFPHF